MILRSLGSHLFRTLAVLCGCCFPHEAGAGISGVADVPVVVRHRPIQLDGDRAYEGLAVAFDVRFAMPGAWAVSAAIAPRGDFEGWSLRRTASSMTDLDLRRVVAGQRMTGTGDTVRTDPSGHARFQLCFEGDGLARLCADGPWDVQLRAHRVPDASSVDARQQVFRSAIERRKRTDFEVRYGDEFDPYWFDEAWTFGPPPAIELAFTKGWDLVVAEVAGADTGGARGHPPKVMLRVTRVLQGAPGPRNLEVGWDPVPLYLPCMTGEEENIKRWEATAYPAPAVGTRWILGVSFSPYDHAWHGEAFFREPYSDSLLARFEPEAKQWKQLMPKLRQAFARVQAPRTKAERRRIERERRAQIARERSWLVRARERARAADVEGLVEVADCIAVGVLDLPSARPAPDNASRSSPFRVVDRLLWFDGWDKTDPAWVHLVPNDQPVTSIWQGAPQSREPGARNGPPLHAIVFGHRARLHAPWENRPSSPVLRLVDGAEGIQLADPALVRRVLRALARRASRREHASAWRDFAALPESSLATVGVKLSPLYMTALLNRRSLVLECSPAHRSPPLGYRERFWSSTLPDSTYRVDLVRTAWSYTVRPDEMAWLLDSLVSLASVQARRLVANDSMSLTLRRRSAGREISFECTLDPASIEHLSRIVAEASMPPEHYVGPTSKPRPSKLFGYNAWGWLYGLSPSYAEYAKALSLRYPYPPRTRK